MAYTKEQFVALGKEGRVKAWDQARANAYAKALRGEAWADTMELTFGQLIWARREREGLERSDVAGKIGISDTLLEQWENDEQFNTKTVDHDKHLMLILHCQKGINGGLFLELARKATPLQAVSEERILSEEEKLRANALADALKGKGNLSAGQFIQARREQLNLKRVNVADAVGVSEDTLKKWENDLTFGFDNSERKAALKTVLQCVGNEYDALFDKLVVKPPKEQSEAEKARAEALEKALKGEGELTAGQFIRARRENLGLSREDMSKTLGVSDVTISVWESGHSFGFDDDGPRKAALKTFLQCEENEYTALFDDLVSKAPVDTKIDKKIVAANARLQKVLAGEETPIFRDFIKTRREGLGKTSEGVAAEVGISVSAYGTLENATKKRPLSEDRIGALKDALQCRGNEYETLFDTLLQESLQPKERPPPIVPVSNVRDSFAAHELPVPMLSKDFVEAAVDGLIRLTPVQFLGYRLTSLRFSKSWPKIQSESDITREVFESYVDGSMPIPPAQYAALKTALNCDQGKFRNYFDSLFPPVNMPPVAASSPPLQGVEYVAATEKMLQAFVRGEKDVWNEELQTLIADKPNVRLDWRGVNMSVTNADYSGFDFSQCDLRGMSWPEPSLDADKQLTKELVLRDAVLVNGVHDKTNAEFNALQRGVQELYRKSQRETFRE